MNHKQYVCALNESKDRNDKLKRQNLDLFERLCELEEMLADYEGEEDE